MSHSNRSERSEPLDAIALDEIIRHRRTFKPPMMSMEPVSDDDLQAILENANWAPSHGLTEPWRFKIYRGSARESLATALGDLYDRLVPEEKKKPGKSDKLRAMPLLAPVVMLIWMQRQKTEKIAELEEVAAVACAVQNMHLTAASRGLGAFWSTPPFIYDPGMNQWMGISEKDRCLGIFYIGHPSDSSRWPTSRRRPVEAKIEWIDA